jgi:hypothetical protein
MGARPGIKRRVVQYSNKKEAVGGKSREELRRKAIGGIREIDPRRRAKTPNIMNCCRRTKLNNLRHHVLR